MAGYIPERILQSFGNPFDMLQRGPQALDRFLRNETETAPGLDEMARQASNGTLPYAPSPMPSPSFSQAIDMGVPPTEAAMVAALRAMQGKEAEIMADRTSAATNESARTAAAVSQMQSIFPEIVFGGHPAGKFEGVINNFGEQFGVSSGSIENEIRSRADQLYNGGPKYTEKFVSAADTDKFIEEEELDSVNGDGIPDPIPDPATVPARYGGAEGPGPAPPGVEEPGPYDPGSAMGRLEDAAREQIAEELAEETGRHIPTFRDVPFDPESETPVPGRPLAPDPYTQIEDWGAIPQQFIDIARSRGDQDPFRAAYEFVLRKNLQEKGPYHANNPRIIESGMRGYNYTAGNWLLDMYNLGNPPKPASIAEDTPSEYMSYYRYLDDPKLLGEGAIKPYPRTLADSQDQWGMWVRASGTTDYELDFNWATEEERAQSARHPLALRFAGSRPESLALRRVGYFASQLPHQEALLYARAGITGKGEMDRLRAEGVKGIIRRWKNEVLANPDPSGEPREAVSLLQFASTIKGSPWYIAPTTN